MEDRLTSGPYRLITLDDGTVAPYYILPFDKRGLCEAPETLRRLVETVQDGFFTDIFVFAHGWNTVWRDAVARYEHFLNGYLTMRRTHQLPMPPTYRPLLVGIFWPSAALAFGAELGPDLAVAEGDGTVDSAGEDAVGDAAIDAAIAQERAQVRELAEALPPEQAARFYALVQKPQLTAAEARELAMIAQVFYTTPDLEFAETATPDVDEILAIWAAAMPPVAEEGPADGVEIGLTEGEDVSLAAFDPRQIVRLLTVYQMKDRAGVVGAQGVGPLLRDLLQAQRPVRLHLIGHSFGAKVLLSAVCHGKPLPHGRQVESMLLLQPAVSHLCFAHTVANTGKPGGYHTAPSRINKPILTTFSAKDGPLVRFFHLALRRQQDLLESIVEGQEGTAANEPPSIYAALGGYGPRGADEQLIEVLDVGQAYQLDPAVPVYGIHATRSIGDHGDISNPATWWALYTLVAR